MAPAGLDEMGKMLRSGKTSLTISDKNKLVKAIYMGKIADNKTTWVITESA